MGKVKIENLQLPIFNRTQVDDFTIEAKIDLFETSLNCSRTLAVQWANGQATTAATPRNTPNTRKKLILLFRVFGVFPDPNSDC
jgi:hypothetical protein